VISIQHRVQSNPSLAPELVIPRPPRARPLDTFSLRSGWPYVLILAFCLLGVSSALAEMPAIRWASRAGGMGQDFGTAISVDKEGNTYTCGYFRGQARVDEYALAGKGVADIFVA